MGDVFEMKGGGKTGIYPLNEMENAAFSEWMKLEDLLSEVGAALSTANWTDAHRWLVLLEGQTQSLSIRLRLLGKMEEWRSKKIRELRPGAEPTPAV